MASIKRREDGQWRARYRDATGKEHAKHFERKADGERWLHTEQSKVDRGNWFDPARGKVTVGDWSHRWLTAQLQLKPSTRQRHASTLAMKCEPTWGHVPSASVSPASATEWGPALSASGPAGLTFPPTPPGPAPPQSSWRVAPASHIGRGGTCRRHSR